MKPQFKGGALTYSPINPNKTNVTMSDDIYYRHFRDASGHPYATLAAIVIPSTGTVVGGSIVSDQDQFEYKIGRQIATNRAKAIKKGKFPRHLAVFIPTCTTREQAIEFITQAEIQEEENEANPQKNYYIIHDPSNSHEMIYRDNIRVPNKYDVHNAKLKIVN